MEKKKFFSFLATEALFSFFPSLNRFQCWKRCILSSGKSFPRPNIKIVRNRFFWTNICHHSNKEVLLLSMCTSLWILVIFSVWGWGQEIEGPYQSVIFPSWGWRKGYFPEWWDSLAASSGSGFAVNWGQSWPSVWAPSVVISHAFSVTHTGHHGTTPTRGEGKNSWTGGDIPPREEQAGRGSGQMGWQRQWHHCAGQTDVYDHDGDDRLHKVRHGDRKRKVFSLKITEAS